MLGYTSVATIKAASGEVGYECFKPDDSARCWVWVGSFGAGCGQRSDLEAALRRELRRRAGWKIVRPLQGFTIESGRRALAA